MADYKTIKGQLIQNQMDLIESSDREIEWLNKEIAERRIKDKNMIEWVWSKGVVNEWEMRCYTKDYKSTEMKSLLKQREREYRWRARQRYWLERWSKL